MRKLLSFVEKHTNMGNCKCVECLVKENKSHTLDLSLFKVGMRGKPSANKFLELAVGIIPGKKEVSYASLQNVVGSRNYALRIMALGHLLGVWEILTPDIMVPNVDEKTKKMAALSGMITYRLKKDKVTDDGRGKIG